MFLMPVDLQSSQEGNIMPILTLYSKAIVIVFSREFKAWKAQDIKNRPVSHCAF